MIKREYALIRTILRDALRAYQIAKWENEARKALKAMQYTRAEIALDRLTQLKADASN